MQTKVSYYKVDGILFNSKIQAALFAQKTNKPLEWVFTPDSEFSKYPWHIEPLSTLDQLYDKRARELREKYDYLILGYSVLFLVTGLSFNVSVVCFPAEERFFTTMVKF